MFTRKSFLIFLAVVIALIVGFIWGNSCLSGEQSSAISDFVMRLLGFERQPAQNAVHGVRKLGHFMEFLALGGALYLFLSEISAHIFSKLTVLVCCGMFFPLIDETIQIFNDRNPLVQDIWIDISGYALGCLVALVSVFGCRFIKLKNKSPDNQS